MRKETRKRGRDRVRGERDRLMGDIEAERAEEWKKREGRERQSERRE